MIRRTASCHARARLARHAAAALAVSAFLTSGGLSAAERNVLVGRTDSEPREEWSKRASAAARVHHDSRSTSAPPICSGDAGNLLYPLNASNLWTWTPALPACDDCSGPSVPLPFEFDFWGDTYDAVFVNNNGDLTFSAPYGPYLEAGFPDDRYVMLAPFWADTDARENPEPQVPADVHQKFVDSDRDGRLDTFVATWRNIGYYSRRFDRRDTFQVAISDGRNPLMGIGNNVCFSYDRMCWTTGDFNGVGGFGGTPAWVGANRGNGIDWFLIGGFDRDGAAYDGPYGTPGGIQYLDQKRFCFSTESVDGNLCPFATEFPAGDRVVLRPSESLSRSFRLLSPEPGQTTTVSVEDADGAQAAGLQIASTPANAPTVDLLWSPTCDSLGEYRIDFHATDDFGPPCTKSRGLEIVVTCDDGNPCTEDTCDFPAQCRHTPISEGQTTCGTGACMRTVDACLDGVPQACVPGTPSPEVCNGIDDDCDGRVDEGLRVRIGLSWSFCPTRPLDAQ